MNREHTQVLKMGVPKKGRLFEKTMALLEQAGLDFRRDHRSDVASCLGIPLMLVFLPAQDIPLYVGEGDVQLGITGQDTILESRVKISELTSLGFGRCQLSVLVPEGKAKSVEELWDKKIVTSFPNITADYFGGQGVNISIKELSGSVEAACALGLADAVVDLVESGETMRAANLEKIAVIIESQAVFISNAKFAGHEMARSLKLRFEGIVTARKFVMVEYNIPREFLGKGKQITPGLKSPTVMPTEDPDWLAVKSTISRSEINQKIEALRAAGASDIMVYNIENCSV